MYGALTGHIITLDDSDNAPYIEIVDNTGKNTIKLDAKNNKLTVHLEGDMLFEATKGDIMLKAKTVTVEASDALKMKGKSLDAEATQAANIKAGSDLKLKGMSADISVIPPPSSVSEALPLSSAVDPPFILSAVSAEMSALIPLSFKSLPALIF